MNLDMTLSHNVRMTNASNRMACHFAGAIARVWRYNQSPHPSHLLSKDAAGCEAKHKYYLCSTHCLLRETGQMHLYFFWFCCVACFWNSLLTTNNSLLGKICAADLRLAHKKGSWTCEVLSALSEIPGDDAHISAIMRRCKINMSEFVPLLREHTIQEWKDLDQIHPLKAHVSS